MIKKIFITCFIVLGLTFQANAIDCFDILNKTMDTIDRASQYIPKKNYDSSQTNDYPDYGQNTEPSTMPSREQSSPMPQGRTNNPKGYSRNLEVVTLGDLPAGTIVVDSSSVWNYRNGDNYSGEIYLKHPVFWIKLEDNHFSQGATLLLSYFGIGHYDFCHSQKGLRAWNESDVRRFLRTTFYTHLSQGFKNSIVNVNIPYADLTGKPATILDNLFLLSIVEWGASDRANNGKGIKYNDLPALYDTKKLIYVDSWGNYDIRNYYGTNLTRTINRPMATSAGYKDDVFVIKEDGTLRTTWVNSTLPVVQPAVNLKSTTQVEGPYLFNYDYAGKKHFKYYILKFSSMQ